MRKMMWIASTLLAISAAGSSAWANVYPMRGNVGIGTDAPQNPLHILTDPSNRQIRMQDPAGFWEFWAGGNFHIREDGAADRLFIAGESGNVGIGTTSPGQRLHVVGNVLASGYLTASDARLKADVTRLGNTLDKLQRVRGVSFTWNDAGRALGYPAETREIGVIAQEVEEIFPELVVSSGGYKAVDYSRLSGVLVEAMKELKAQKDAEIADLKARIETIENARSRQEAARQMSTGASSSGWAVCAGLLGLVGLGLRRRSQRS